MWDPDCSVCKGKGPTWRREDGVGGLTFRGEILPSELGDLSGRPLAVLFCLCVLLGWLGPSVVTSGKLQFKRTGGDVTEQNEGMGV